MTAVYDRSARDRLRRPQGPWAALHELSPRTARVLSDFGSSVGEFGMCKAEPVAITSGVDPTVRLVGSAISVLKPLVIEGRVPAGGVWLAQPCLRARNLPHLDRRDFYLRWPSYFLQIGAVMPADGGQVAARAALAFLLRQVGGDRSRIALRGSRTDSDILSLHDDDVVVEYDDDPARYLHSYGVEGMSGRNINYGMVDDRGEVHDVGNLIMITLDGVPAAVELAFGPSNILTRLHALDHLLQAATVAEAVPLRSWAHLRLADALAAATVLLGEGLRPAGSGRHRAARGYMQALSGIRRQARVSLDEVEEWVRTFQRSEYGVADTLPARLTSYLATYEELSATGANTSAAVNMLSARAFSDGINS